MKEMGVIIGASICFLLVTSMLMAAIALSHGDHQSVGLNPLLTVLHQDKAVQSNGNLAHSGIIDYNFHHSGNMNHSF